MFRLLTGGFALLAATLSAAAEAPPRFGANFTLPAPSVRLIWVAPGTFLMAGTHGSGDDTEVRITRGYWLGRTEITQEQWQAVMTNIPLPSLFKGSERPVEQVSWGSAIIFCQNLTELERAAGRLPPGYIYTLPTEAQWEYACRAGTTGSYAGAISALGWYDENSGGETHPVAQKRPNAWGFYDMQGNVAEWCFDWYASYPGGSVSDPAGPLTGQFRVLRGGAFAGPAGFGRSAMRNWSPTNAGSASIGFRLALAPTPKPSVH